MFKNKHFLIALIVAPILSIMAYVGTDLAFSEKPHTAQQGATYKLVSKSNCRYTSGLCDMENGEFKVQFRSDNLSPQQLTLSLRSKLSLDSVKVALADQSDAQATPVTMLQNKNDNHQWSITLPAPASSEAWLRVVIHFAGAIYYGDTQTKFVTYETLLSHQDVHDNQS